MSSDYAVTKIKEALMLSKGNTARAWQTVIAWCHEDAKLRPDQKLVAMRHWDTPERRVQGVKSLMKELAGL